MPTINEKTGKSTAGLRMSRFSFACVSCGKILEADKQEAWSPMVCPDCGRVVTVPDGESLPDRVRQTPTPHGGMKCTHTDCGHLNQPNANYCERCGRLLVHEAAAQDPSTTRAEDSSQDALRQIERMHETQTVRRESIIGWYRWYSVFHKFPPMYPERSDVDLVRTIALWMELTDRGGSPGFPYEYKTDITFSTSTSSQSTKQSIASILGFVGMVGAVIGIAALFFNWKTGLAVILGSVLSNLTGYWVAGGSSNPSVMTPGTRSYRAEGKRVLEWVAKQGVDDTNASLT